MAYYVKGSKVLAVSSMGADPAVAKAAELMYQGKMYCADDIRCGCGRVGGDVGVEGWEGWIGYTSVISSRKTLNKTLISPNNLFTI